MALLPMIIDVPSVPVATTDSLEIQRQKINTLAAAMTSSSNFTGVAVARATFRVDTGAAGVVRPINSHRVTSIAKTGTGAYTITLTDTLPSATPCVIASLWKVKPLDDAAAVRLGEVVSVSTTQTSVNIIVMKEHWAWNRSYGSPGDFLQQPVPVDTECNISVTIYA